MSTLEVEQSKLAGSINRAISAPLSSTAGVSGSAPLTRWLQIGQWGFDLNRVVAMGNSYARLNIWLDTGHNVTLELTDIKKMQFVETEILAGRDVSAHVKSVQIASL